MANDPIAWDGAVGEYGTVDAWALENGCIPTLTNGCPQRCTAMCRGACLNDCNTACQGACDEACHVNDCAPYCESLDLMGVCQDSCVSGCVDTAHAVGPFVGAKYGYTSDLNHNLVRVRDGNGDLYLENQYGTDIANPDFDSVVHQQFGDTTVEMNYRDLAGEAAGFITAPTTGPAAAYIDSLSEFNTVDICRSDCSDAPVPPATYTPWEDMLFQFVGDSAPTGLAVISKKFGRATIPPTTFRLIDRGKTVLAQAHAEDTGPFPGGPRMGSFAVGLASGRLTFVSAGKLSFEVSGSAAARAELLALGEITILSNSFRDLRVYPGHPTTILHMSKGRCTKPFTVRPRARATGVEITPASACTDEMLLTPLASVTTDTLLIAEYQLTGNKAFARKPVFLASILTPERAIVRWKASSSPGTMERTTSPSRAAATKARVAVVKLARKFPIGAIPTELEKFDGPMYVFHDTAPPLDGTLDRYFDGLNIPFDGFFFEEYCDRTPRLPVLRGVGDFANGPKPVRATVLKDFHGVSWTYYFDKNGRPIRIKNQGTGAVRSMNYDAIGQLTGVEHPLGDRLCLLYDSRGNVLDSFEFPSVNVLGPTEPIRNRYAYTTFPSRLKNVYDPRGANLDIAPTQIMTTMNWDNKGNLISVTDASNNTSTITLVGGTGPDRASARQVTRPDGSITTFEYDATTGRTSQQTVDANGASPVVTEIVSDSAGRTVWAKTPLGEVLTWDFFAGRLRSTTRDADGLFEFLEYTYDSDGQTTSVSRGDRTTSFMYDALGNVRTVTTVANDQTATTTVSCRRHGPDGRLLEAVLPEGDRVSYTYDGEGRVTRVTAGSWPSLASWDDACPAWFEGGISVGGVLKQIEYTLNGQPELISDALTSIAIVYDGHGRPSVVSNPTLASTRAGYDELGNVLWTSSYDALGLYVPYGTPGWGDLGLLAAATSTYDTDGRLSAHAAWHFDAASLPIGDGFATTTFAYDLGLNQVTVTADDQGVTRARYDGAGRPVSTQLPTGAVIATSYLNGGRIVHREAPAPTPSGTSSMTTQLTAWGAPALVESKDAGIPIALQTYIYDSHRRLEKSIGAGENRVGAVYDAFDRPTQVDKQHAEFISETIGYTYNRNGWLQSRTSGSGLLDATTEYYYDALGRTRQMVAPDGASTSADYLGTSQAVQQQTDQAGTTFAYTYDATGQVFSVASTPGGQLRSYWRDGLGRVTDAYRSGELPTWSPATVIRTYLSWDSLGNKTSESDNVLGLLGKVEHTHDGRGLPIASTLGNLGVQRSFDPIGRLKTVTLSDDPKPAVQFWYDTLGGPIKRQYGGITDTLYRYDAFGRLAGLTDQTTSQLAKWRWEIPRDDMPRIAGFERGLADEVASVFSADQTGRVTAESHGLVGLQQTSLTADATTTDANTAIASLIGAGEWTTYAMDGRHNWVSVEDQAGTITPGIGVTDAYSDFSLVAPQYDGNGSLTSYGTDQFVYDSFGELDYAETNNARRSYVRDAFSRVVAEQNGADVTLYGYDGAQRVIRQRPGGDVDVTVQGSGIDEHLVRVDAGGKRAFYHQERMGSVYMLTDSNGSPVEWYDYTAYGEMTVRDEFGRAITASQHDNRFGFQGQQFDLALGLVDMRARTYRPEWGRFLQRDPIGLAGGTNLYAFVDSSPLMWMDPLGLCKNNSDRCISVASGGSFPLRTMPIFPTDRESAQFLESFERRGKFDSDSDEFRGPSGEGYRVALARGGTDVFDRGEGGTILNEVDYSAPAARLNYDVYGVEWNEELDAHLISFGSHETAHNYFRDGWDVVNMVSFYVSLGLGVGEVSGFLVRRGALAAGAETIAVSAGAENIANGPRLAAQLSSDEAASVFTEAGTLHPEVIAGSDVAVPGVKLTNQGLIGRLTADGSKIADWAKFSTKSFKSPAGSFQVHFYQNLKTGAINFADDFKVVFNHQGKWP